MNWVFIVFIVLLCAGFALFYISSGEEEITKFTPHQAHDDIEKYKWANRAFAKQWLDLMSHDPADLDQYVRYTEQLVKKYTSGSFQQKLGRDIAEVRAKQNEKITMAYPVLANELNGVVAAMEYSGIDLPRDAYLKTTRMEFDV